MRRKAGSKRPTRHPIGKGMTAYGIIITQQRVGNKKAGRGRMMMYKDRRLKVKIIRSKKLNEDSKREEEVIIPRQVDTREVDVDFSTSEKGQRMDNVAGRRRRGEVNSNDKRKTNNKINKRSRWWRQKGNNIACREAKGRRTKGVKNQRSKIQKRWRKETERNLRKNKAGKVGRIEMETKRWLRSETKGEYKARGEREDKGKRKMEEYAKKEVLTVEEDLEDNVEMFDSDSEDRK